MKAKYRGPERRKEKRLEVNFITICKVEDSVKADVLFGNEEFGAAVVDLSPKGMALVSEHKIPPAVYFRIKFVLPYSLAEEQFRVIEVRGRVRYSKPLKNDLYRLGVSFVRIKKGDRAAISEFIKKSRKA